MKPGRKTSTGEAAVVWLEIVDHARIVARKNKTTVTNALWETLANEASPHVLRYVRDVMERAAKQTRFPF